MKIKICGLKREEDIDIVNQYPIDYIGFVFAKSKRQITLEKAKKLKEKLNKNIKAVGVFVDEDIENIRWLVDHDVIDVIQLHGHEDDTYIKNVKAFNKPIIKAIKIINEESLLQRYDVDYYLLDNSQAGSGKSFNWDYIQPLDKPIFLAGGININNIEEAMKQDVYALDLSSGVEEHGIKDQRKIEEIMRVFKYEG